MNRTINITINRLVFSLEEDAYNRLNGYLEEIKRYFSAFTYGSEVIADIESRIAEQFNALIGPKQQVITLPDVENLIKVMGSVADITSGSRESGRPEIPLPPKPPVRRRLYRSTENVMIAGVAAGLAAYLDWDVTVMRLLFVLISLTTFVIGPYAVAAYLIFWLVVPKAVTGSAKLEMRGEDVTIANLEENVKENKGKKPSPIREMTTVASQVIRLALKVAVILFGLAIAGFSFAGLVFLAILFAQLLFNSASPYVDFPVREIFSGGEYLILLSSGFLLVALPGVVTLLAGISLIRRKLIFGKIPATVIVGIWVIALVTTSVIAIRGAPKMEETAATYRQAVSRDYPELQGFKSVEVSGNTRVRVDHGESFAVSGTSGLKDNSLRLKVEGGTLKINRENSRPKICIFCGFVPAEVAVTMPELKTVRADGASRISISGFKQDSLALNLDGASRSEANKVELKETDINASGASRATISGKTGLLKITADGASRIDGSELKYDKAMVNADGSSRVTVGSGKNLSVKGSGASRIYYFGSPEIESQLDRPSRLFPNSDLPDDDGESIE